MYAQLVQAHTESQSAYNISGLAITNQYTCYCVTSLGLKSAARHHLQIWIIRHSFAELQLRYLHTIPSDTDTVPVPNAELINNLTCVNSNMSVFHKRDLPRRHHYVNNDRIDDVLLVVKDHWQADKFEPYCGVIAAHGWDPSFANLRVG